MAAFANDPLDFLVERPCNYKGRSPKYDLPFEIGCFSIDAKSKYRNDGHQMKYLSMPDKLNDLCMDLKGGFDDYIHVFEDTDYLYSAILKWILSHQQLISKYFIDLSSCSPKIDFVCFRGALTTITSTIYEKSEDWAIFATKFKSVIYLSEVRTDMKSEAEESAPEERKRMSTWGFKFEQYMVSDTVSSKPDTSVPVNENEKYIAIFKGKLENHRLLFAAEMDGVDPKHLSRCNASSPLRYIELKTSRILTTEKQERNFRRYKLIKWYLQSYLAGVPQVICGFRDDEGIVRKLEIFDVADMPKMANGIWYPDACLNFTSQFLDHVKRCVVKDAIDYSFWWDPSSGRISCEELEGEPAFLPEWYTSKVTVFEDN